MSDALMSVTEVAEYLGIAPQSVRTKLARYGIREERGYPRQQVLTMKWKGQGHRSDLERKDVAERHAHKTSAGRCEHCNRPWPCPDYLDASGMTPLF